MKEFMGLFCNNQALISEKIFNMILYLFLEWLVNNSKVCEQECAMSCSTVASNYVLSMSTSSWYALLFAQGTILISVACGVIKVIRAWRLDGNEICGTSPRKLWTGLAAVGEVHHGYCLRGSLGVWLWVGRRFEEVQVWQHKQCLHQPGRKEELCFATIVGIVWLFVVGYFYAACRRASLEPLTHRCLCCFSD